MIQLEKYNTILSDRELTITDVRWGGGEFAAYYTDDNVTYQESVCPEFSPCELYIIVFDHYSKSLYRIEFVHIHGYRLLDEGGLLDFWACEAYNQKELGCIIKVRHSPWSKESEIPFVYSKETSCLIVTDNECVEIITEDAPVIHFLKKVEPKEGNCVPWDKE